MSLNSFYKFGDVGSYLLDFDAKINYGDRYVFINRRDDEVTMPSTISGSYRSYYQKVKVIWYYEKPGVENTVLHESWWDLIRSVEQEVRPRLNRPPRY